MNLLSAKNVFSDIFEWFANLSSKLPAIDYKTYFIVVVAIILGVGLIVALTYFGSYRFKLLVACKKIISYLADVEAIDNDNFGDFTSQCFSEKVPSTLRDCWVQYLGVRFGYPSDIVSEQNVYDREVKRVREIRANVFIAVALILIAIFSFWGYGRLDGKDMGVIFLASLLLSGVIYLVLVIINKILSNTCLDAFNDMQEDLDAKVVFQVEKTFATDASPLGDLAAIIDEIVARNTAKEIGFEFGDEQTPIEELIAKADDADGQGDDGANDDGAETVENVEVAEKIDVKDEVVDEIELEDDAKSEPSAEEKESADGAAEDDNLTIDDIIVEEIDLEEEEHAGEDAKEEHSTEDEPVVGEEPVEEAEPVRDEEPVVEAEPISESEPILEAEVVNEEKAAKDEPVQDEPTVEAESEPAVENNPFVDDGAIDGVVEDIKVESEPEQPKKQTSEIIGEPVEIITEKGPEAKQEDKASKDDAQKKTINDEQSPTVCNEKDAKDEQSLTDDNEKDVEDEQKVEAEASSDVNGQTSSVESEQEVARPSADDNVQNIEEAQTEVETSSDINEQPIEEPTVEDEQSVEEPTAEVAPEVKEEPTVEEPIAEQKAETKKEEKQKPHMEELKEETTVKVDGDDGADDGEPIIQYVVDGPMDDDDEIVKPAQLVKMPNLVDYMIAQNASPKLKMNIVNRLMASYKRFENSEEDKKIIDDCIRKLMADLQKNNK